jgi:hypothetical protein
MNRSFILVIALLVTASAWSQVPATFFGMTINHIPKEEKLWPNVPLGAIRLWDTGTSWRALNPAPGVYEWSKLDEWFRIAKQHNVDILYTFGRTPDWASSNPQAQCSYGPGQCASPKDLRAWDEFVRALAAHSAGRIKYWEIWNEANRPESWTGGIPQLVDMAKRAKTIIQAVDLNAVILTPSATGKDGPEWLAAYLKSGGADPADVIAFHGYCGTDPENLAVLLEKYKLVVAEHGLRKKPLWDTEASWGKSDKLPDQRERAAFLAVAYLLHLSNGIERFYWYAWDNAEWGTLARGSEMEPAGHALRQITELVQSSSLEKPCARNSESIWSCTFFNKKERVLVTWSPRQQTVPTPNGYTRASDLAGNQIPFTKTLTLTQSPIFLLKQQREPLAEIKR